MIVRKLRHELFIVALQTAPKFAGGRRFGKADLLFERNGFGQFQRHNNVRALIVGAVVADFAAAGAQTRDRNGDLLNDACLSADSFGQEAYVVVHEAL